jgi:hypothetical protein
MKDKVGDEVVMKDKVGVSDKVGDEVVLKDKVGDEVVMKDKSYLHQRTRSNNDNSICKWCSFRS